MSATSTPTRLLPVRDGRGRLLGLVLVGLAVLPTPSGAQPRAITPEDVAERHRWIDSRSDRASTAVYDLSRLQTLEIRVEGLLLPESGNAELLFSVLEEAVGALNLKPGRTYHATLQVAREFRRLRFSRRSFPRGARARLSGWPASGGQRSPAVLLVKDIELGGRRLSLHENPDPARVRQEQDGPAPDT
jgi:hypothetical protein